MIKVKISIRQSHLIAEFEKMCVHVSGKQSPYLVLTDISLVLN